MTTLKVLGQLGDFVGGVVPGKAVDGAAGGGSWERRENQGIGVRLA